MSTTRSRLIDAGWSLVCERYVDLGSGDGAQLQRHCTWRAAKGVDEFVVRSQIGDEEVALRYLYDMAKTIDPDLQQLAMEAGSGGWVFDLSQTESELHGKD